MKETKKMDTYDARFFRSILVGAAVAVPTLWAAMTVGFMLLGGHAFVDAVGISGLPAVFCGPFLGGLFSTAAVHEDVPEAAPAPLLRQDEERLAA